MRKSGHQDHHLVTLYADTEKQDLHSLFGSITPDKDTRILSPQDEDALLQAAQNSSLIVIGIKNQKDSNINIARLLKDNRMVVADVMAVFLQKEGMNPFEIMARGFDICVSLEECQQVEFKSILKQRLIQGSRRISGFILEEEYRRFSDALSCAPTSVIVFDQEKRIVFVSEHYFRAYPQSAPRLVRGLSVYDAFEMMSFEENMLPGDPRYPDIRQFWYDLSGDIEFTLDNGISYRMKATPLPNDRGTIVTAQNITEYVRQNVELQKALERLKKAEKS